MTSQGNTFKAPNDIDKQPNTRSRSKETQSYEEMSSFEIVKNVWERLSKPLKGGVIIKENPAIDEQISSSEYSNEKMPHPNIM